MTAQPWTIRVEPLSDELFSTWLVRAALAQGCDPMHLTGWLWPTWRAWTVDLDRGVRRDRLATLANRSGVNISRIEAAMLPTLLAAVAPDEKAEKSVWPWVLSRGSRNRRRNGGLQFCPQCLDQDTTPYFRRTWRLAWHIGCAQHGTLLADHCGHCYSPIEPHRVRGSDPIWRCPSCGLDLRETETEVACADAMAFQSVADLVLSSGQGMWRGSVVSCEAWFRLAAKSASGQILGRLDDPVVHGVTSLALNFQRPSERVLRLRMAYRSMRGEPRGKPVILPPGRPSPAVRAKAADGTQRKPSRQPTLPRHQAKVQGEWVRLLRRQRVGHP